MESSVRRVTEESAAAPFPLLLHPEWADRWPWLVQGITGAGPGCDWDLALFGPAPAGPVMERWEVLRDALPVLGIVHARQVHGSAIRFHDQSLQGLHLALHCDGHLTRMPGLLLAVSVADCVPAYLVAPEIRAVGVLHAGWRGAAAGVLEAGVHAFRDRLGVGPDSLHLHLGPSICGACYEVGPEVHRALGEPVPDGPEPVDLAGNLGRRAVAAGIPHPAVTRSFHCTRCGAAALFSHRGGDAGRQVAFVAVAGGR